MVLTRCERSQIFTKNTPHVTIRYTRLGRSDTPTPCTGSPGTHAHRKHSDNAQAQLRRWSASRRALPTLRTARHAPTTPCHRTRPPSWRTCRTHTLHGMQACSMRLTGTRAAAAAAAVMGAMVPPLKTCPGRNPRLSEGSVPPDTPEGGHAATHQKQPSTVVDCSRWRTK